MKKILVLAVIAAAVAAILKFGKKKHLMYIPDRGC